ncbi:MAG TPA: alkaline phosphatase family protein, partial [Vicinamibacterales bacterium]|nr:alkaline phosphatase family protein [Vicinamibacterales bacterium]
LVALGQRGIVFRAHHAVFPAVTRVNVATFMTGVYPEAHGLLGNNIFIPSVNPARGLDTGSRENLEAVARAEGTLLTAPTLAEILERSGKKLVGIGSGTSGAAFLLDPTIANGAIIHQEFTRPESLAATVLATLGPPPAGAMPNEALNRRVVDAYEAIALERLHPDVTVLWISDPDHTAHNKGIGTPVTLRALELVDANIGRIEDSLKARGLLDRTDIIVTSDHGFSTHGGTLNLEAIVRPYAPVVVSEGAIYVTGGDRDARVRAIVAALQRNADVGAIFTRGGEVAGTLPFDVVRYGHARAGDVLVSANWTREKNDEGYEGRTTDRGVAGHGASSPYDIHNVLIAAGPDFRSTASSDAPTGNVDLTPTLLRLLGLPVPPLMTGRVVEEALRGGSAPAVSHETQTVRSADGAYELTAHISIAAGRRYLDDTEVKRRQ